MKLLQKTLAPVLGLLCSLATLQTANAAVQKVIPIPWDNEQTEASAATILNATLTAKGSNLNHATTDQLKAAVSATVATHQRLAPELVIVAIQHAPAAACEIPVVAMDALGNAPSSDNLQWIAQAALNGKLPKPECACHIILAAIEHLPKNAKSEDVTKLVQLAGTYGVSSECIGNVLAAASNTFPQYAADITDALSQNIGSLADSNNGNDGKDYKGVNDGKSVNDGKDYKQENIGSAPVEEVSYQVPPPGPTLPPVFIGGFPPCPVTPVCNR